MDGEESLETAIIPYREDKINGKQMTGSWRESIARAEKEKD